MAKKDPYLPKISAICLALPDTKLTMTWGAPHFRVQEKIFAGCGEEKDGSYSISVRLEMEHQAVVLTDPRFKKAAYTGSYGGVTFDVTRAKSWDEVRALVEESYRIVAPKKSLAKLGAPEPLTATVKKRRPAKKKTKPAAR